MDKEPFFGFKFNKIEVERPFLSEDETDRITAKEFDIPRLVYVKDVFLFCCYTGLSYVDVQKLKRAEITVGVDGGKCIYANRKKNVIPLSIPLDKGLL